MQQLTDPNRVLLTGENSYVVLRLEENGPPVTRASHWRILLSPVGPGHALFLEGELTEGRPRVYADNERLARWLQQIQSKQSYSDQSVPVTPATFEKSGDARSSWVETVNARNERVELRWSGLGEPFVFRSGPNTRPGVVYGIYSLLIPAQKAEVRLNDRSSSGRAFSKQIGERPGSSACLAFSETWLEAP